MGAACPQPVGGKRPLDQQVILLAYGERCAAGQGIPYNQKEKLMLYGGYVLLGIAFTLAVFNLA